MPQLDNPQHERFCQSVASGKSHKDAYIRAGYKLPKDDRGAGNATRMAKRPHIAARIKEIQAHQAARIGVTVDKLVAQLDRMYNLAAKVKHPAAGVGAVMGKAKLLGLIIEKAEVETVVRKPMREPTDKKSMSVEEWQKKFAPAHLKPDTKPEGSA